MATFAIILAVLVNQVNSQTTLILLSEVNEVYSLPENPQIAINFPRQIQQIQTTSEAAPAAFAGNNLNVVHGTTLTFLGVPEQNFQAISTIRSIKQKKKSNKKNYARERNSELSVFYDESGYKYDDEFETIKKSEVFVKPERLIWDNCIEKDFKESSMIPVKMENKLNDKVVYSFQKHKGINGLRERETGNNLNSTTKKKFVDIYCNLINIKSEKRRQQPNLPTIKRPIESTTTPSTSTVTLPTTVQIIPITREVFKTPVISNSTYKNTVTESTITLSYTEDWLVEKDRSQIRFNELPQKATYLMPSLRLDEGFYPFGFMSNFFYLIYPFEFPIGFIQDVVWGDFTFPYSFLQSIKVESTFLAFIIVFTCIALVIPVYVLILGILSLFLRPRSDDEIETGALFLEAENSDGSDKALVFITLFIVLICCVLIAGMVVSNEQAHAAASDGRNVVSCACSDIASWLSQAARELHHSLVPPVDLVLHAYKQDLNSTHTLLGEPIQMAISSESGIDLVFDSLADIVTESKDLSSKISSLRNLCVEARELASVASDRITELARQLQYLKKHCSLKDLPLCDTINTQSLELSMKFDLILHEQQLLELGSLGVEHLTRAISAARQEFKTLPTAIMEQTTNARDDILRDIEMRRQAVHNSAKIFNDIVRHLTSGLHTVARQLELGLERVQRYESLRWTLMHVCIAACGLVMMLIILAMLCGCGHTSKSYGTRTLKISAAWLCLTSLLLWVLISAVFLISGHAEIYVCHALWDYPKYDILTELLDKPSPLLPNEEGIFDAIFRDLHKNITIDVSVKDVLSECEKDRPAYVVFRLDRILDVNKETSYYEWTELQNDFRKLGSSIDVKLLKTITVNLNKLLNEILRVSDVNLANYRMDYNVPVVGKDLPSLADQLEKVAAQVTDLTTAGRLDTLATRTQRVYLTNIKPLEELRAEMVFKLTELELQLSPFRRKLNISLSHIHTAQFYIDNQGDVIAQKKVSLFISRLISHAAGWRTHVLTSTEKHAARCGPLFSVYAATRALLCSRYVASLHGWWVCGFFLGISWCTTLTPLCVKLWRSYGRKIRRHSALGLSHLASGQQETPTTALCSSNWNTPGPPVPPPRSDSW